MEVYVGHIPLGITNTANYLNERLLLGILVSSVVETACVKAHHPENLYHGFSIPLCLLDRVRPVVSGAFLQHGHLWRHYFSQSVACAPSRHFCRSFAMDFHVFLRGLEYFGGRWAG